MWTSCSHAGSPCGQVGHTEDVRLEKGQRLVYQQRTSPVSRCALVGVSVGFVPGD